MLNQSYRTVPKHDELLLQIQVALDKGDVVRLFELAALLARQVGWERADQMVEELITRWAAAWRAEAAQRSDEENLNP